MLHFKMEMKYLISNPSETMVLKTSSTLVRIRRSWQKYYSLAVLKKWFSDVKLAQMTKNLILNCIELYSRMHLGECFVNYTKSTEINITKSYFQRCKYR